MRQGQKVVVFLQEKSRRAGALGCTALKGTAHCQGM
jgi:hypothetical protein